MILIRDAKFFGLSIFQESSLDFLRVRKESIPMYTSFELAVCLFDMFIRITQVAALNDGDEGVVYDETLAKAFKGFLISDTNATANYAEALMRIAVPWFVSIGFKRKSLQSALRKGCNSECVELYGRLDKDKKLIAYYEGWHASSNDDHLMHLDLVLCLEVYGRTYTDELHEKIQRYLRRYKKNTAIFKWHCVKFVIESMCHFLPGATGLNLLQCGDEVNYFLEHVKDVEESRVIAVGNDRASFKRKWKQMMLVVNEFFVTYKLFTKPRKPLPLVRYREGPQQATDIKSQLVSMITPLPLHISNEKMAAKLCREITKDVEDIAAICESVRAETLSVVASRKRAAENYVADLEAGYESLEAERYARNCYNWEKYHYTRLGRQEKYALYGYQSGLAEEFGLLTGTTLIPFLLLLVCQHPQITPSWLIGFELFDRNGNYYGLKPDGSFAVSEKSRAGFANAQQIIGKNWESKALFSDIQVLTLQAREYLRSIGNDDWRYLLLGRHRGFSEPGRINKLDRIDEHLHVTCPLSIKLVEFYKEDKRQILGRIGLRPLRANVAVMRYLHTGDEHAMSEDLGHVGSGGDDLKGYLPLELREYFSSRRTRLFHNAYIFEAMQDSPYLVDALDFQTLEQLDDFLKYHRLKPLPDSLSLRAFVMDENLDENAVDTSRGVIPVSPVLCTVMVTLADVVDESKARGESVNDVALNWYHTANLIKVIANLHRTGQLATCSPEVVRIFESAEYSPVLAGKLRKLVS